MQTLYRIIDLDDDSIVASGIPTPQQARITLVQYQLDYPNTAFEIDTYKQ